MQYSFTERGCGCAALFIGARETCSTIRLCFGKAALHLCLVKKSKVVSSGAPRGDASCSTAVSSLGSSGGQGDGCADDVEMSHTINSAAWPFA